MNARQQLNRVAFIGCAGAGAAAGLASQSWWIGGAVSVLTLAAALANSDIRLKLSRRRPWRRPARR